MNRFRKLRFIDYHAGDELQVHSSLLNIVLSTNLSVEMLMFFVRQLSSTQLVVQTMQFGSSEPRFPSL
jgi:hypothetical protein